MRGSADRPKKRIHLWKKALLHFSLCFVMGFFTGFAPTSTAVSQLSAQPPTAMIRTLGFSDAKSQNPPPDALASDKSDQELSLRPQLIIITTNHSADLNGRVFLQRLAQTLRLVPPPLLWIVVDASSDAPATEETLRQTGVMYRHITYKGNIADADSDYHRRNIALQHVEHHRLSGIVHFASIFNIYTLQFFKEIRKVEVFGAWPVATVSVSRKRVAIQGPICSSSKVIGWRSKEQSDAAAPSSRTPVHRAESGNGKAESGAPDRINVSGFAFNSTILWDPERWGRPSSIPDSSQDSIRLVYQIALEDESKIRAIPIDCSKVMMWHLRIQRSVGFSVIPKKLLLLK